MLLLTQMLPPESSRKKPKWVPVAEEPDAGFAGDGSQKVVDAGSPGCRRIVLIRLGAAGQGFGRC